MKTTPAIIQRSLHGLHGRPGKSPAHNPRPQLPLKGSRRASLHPSGRLQTRRSSPTHFHALSSNSISMADMTQYLSRFWGLSPQNPLQRPRGEGVSQAPSPNFTHRHPAGLQSSLRHQTSETRGLPEGASFKGLRITRTFMACDGQQE